MANDLPASLQVDVITPEKKFFSGLASMVQVPGYEGVFGVLPGYAPFISLLKPGVIVIDIEGGGQKKIAVAEGISEAVAERCTVLAESAIDCDGITEADIQARFEQARAALAEADSDAERQAAQKKLALAEALQLSL